MIGSFRTVRPELWIVSIHSVILSRRAADQIVEMKQKRLLI